MTPEDLFALKAKRAQDKINEEILRKADLLVKLQIKEEEDSKRRSLSLQELEKERKNKDWKSDVEEKYQKQLQLKN